MGPAPDFRPGLFLNFLSPDNLPWQSSDNSDDSQNRRRSHVISLAKTACSNSSGHFPSFKALSFPVPPDRLAEDHETCKKCAFIQQFQFWDFILSVNRCKPSDDVPVRSVKPRQFRAVTGKKRFIVTGIPSALLRSVCGKIDVKIRFCNLRVYTRDFMWDHTGT